MDKLKLLEGKDVKGVIFDLDGTLVDTLGLYFQAFYEAARECNLEPIAEEKLYALIDTGTGLESILQEHYPTALQEREARLHCMEEMRKAYRRLEEDMITLKPGADEVLPELKKRGIKIGILTASPDTGKAKWAELSRLDVDRYIDVIVTAADVKRKPSPEGLLRCIAELGLSPGDCVLVGDSQADILTGRAAGVATLAITGGVARVEDLAKENPAAIISSLAELPALIDSSTERV